MSSDDPDLTRPSEPEPDPDVTLVRAPEQQVPAGASVVPGYEIVGTLGRGGMGVVYKATQAGLNRVVALKMLLAGPFADPNLRARFLLEAESVAALEHPHIVRVFAFGEYAEHPFLAMEFVPGGTLSERIKTGGPLPAAEAASLLTKLADAVAHAHSRGVVHRDIKPLNVLLTSDGEPRLTDFGLAKVGRADQGLSVTGQVLGTPAYMAPEQAAGKVREVGTAADVYALGAVLYDALTGRPPFAGDSVAVTLQKVLTEEPPRPRKHNPLIPRDLELICLTCLEKDPGKRYARASDLADDLRRVLEHQPIRARRPSAVRRARLLVRRNRLLVAVAVALPLVLLLGAVLGGAVSNRAVRTQPPPEVTPDSAGTGVFVVGRTEPLFDGTAAGWLGRGWAVEEDDEKAKVLEGMGVLQRPLREWANFRVTMRIDLHKASDVELTVASTEEPPDEATSWIVRLHRTTGVVFGRRVGYVGPFEPLRSPISLPARSPAERPYLRIRVERAGGQLSAWLDDAPLGSTSTRRLFSHGLLLLAKDGAVRIEAAEQSELVEQKR